MKTMTKIATPAAAIAVAVMFASSGSAFAAAHKSGAAMATENPALAEALAREYSAMAAEEAVERDAADEAHFSAKAAEAAGNHSVKPDAPTSRTLAATDTAYAERTYQRILNAYDNGAADTHPIELATAQAGYDCWLQESEEGYQLLHIWRCRDAANAALNAIEAPRVAVAEPKPMVMDAQEFTIYFAFDSSELSPAAQDTIAAISSAYSQRDGDDVNVVGHTDTSGSNAYNLALSQRRADSVARALVNQGLSPDLIDEAAVGEIAPAVQTGDGVREPLNRRVVVTIESNK
ncbi:OmpA family protein [Minwuia sp.]|uniref:OmpA family protein n=1 Tax=Minwuia sp. TaxID=2493630 RepID=UPI003A9088FC